ncbi:MAG: hypothetical protein ACLP50_12975 [Solirubrobacteraceae bacterium]
MPIVTKPDETLWIDVDALSEVDALRARLAELGVPVTVLVPDLACDAIVEEVDWSELYPKIVPRNGPEPGIIVDPAEIPVDHTLLLAAHDTSQILPGRAVTIVLSLIHGPAPKCLGKIISPRDPQPRDPRLYPAKPPRTQRSKTLT